MKLEFDEFNEEMAIAMVNNEPDHKDEIFYKKRDGETGRGIFIEDFLGDHFIETNKENFWAFDVESWHLVKL